jgi:hypothetical protein
MLASEGIVPRIIAESERLIHDLIVEAPVGIGGYPFNAGQLEDD